MSANPKPQNHRALTIPDIAHSIAAIMEETRMYGTLACFAVSSRFHHSVLQSSLKTIRKRIVLNMDDFRWRDRSNDANVEIIECRADTWTIPNYKPDSASSLGSATLKHLRQDLTPKALLCIGAPSALAISNWLYLFPSVTNIRISEDIWVHGFSPRPEAGLFAESPGELDWREMIEGGNTFLKQCTLKLDNHVIAQHTIHDSYQGFQTDDPDQQHYFIRAAQANGDVYERTIHATSGSVLGLNKTASITPAVACTLPVMPYKRIDIDCYRQSFYATSTARHIAMAYNSYQHGYEYQHLNKHVDGLAQLHLTSPFSTLTYRLFILNHGGRWQDRVDMKPVYQTTLCCSLPGGTKKVTVLERVVDVAFAGCSENGGCSRCRRAVAEDDQGPSANAA